MERLRKLSDGFHVDFVKGPCPIFADLTDLEVEERGFEDSVFVSERFERKLASAETRLGR